MYIKTKHPINSPNVSIVSHVCPSGQYLSLKLMSEFLAFTKKELLSFTSVVMIDIFISPESKFISTQFTPPLERRSDKKVPKLLRILVLCLLCFALKPLEDTYLDKNNDIYQISVVQVGLLLYLQSYLSIVLTVVKLLWYLRSK